MTYITRQKKQYIINALEHGDTHRAIATKYNISIAEISKIRQSIGITSTFHGGRPKKISKHSANLVTRSIKTGKIVNAVEAQRYFGYNNISDASRWTIRRLLNSTDLFAHKKKKVFPISRDVRKNRLKFAKMYGSWNARDWDKVIIADETRVHRFGGEGYQWVWGERNKPSRPHEVYEVPKGGGGSINLWGCITTHGVGYLTRINSTMDTQLYIDIMNDEFSKTVEWYDFDKSKIKLLQDKDPKHTAKASQEWYKKNNVDLLYWPTYSPDLNPIENMWAYLKRLLHEKYAEPARSLNDLWERIQVIWDSPEMNSMTKTVIHSMPRRCSLIKKNKGGRIHY